MRILHWTEIWRPSIGGVEVLTEKLFAAQRARGHEVCLITGRGAARLPDVEVSGGATIHRMDFQAALAARDPRAIAAARNRVEQAIAASAPDVLHVHTLQPSLFFLETSPSAKRLPTVATLHEPLPEGGARDNLALRMLARCEARVALSRHGAQALAMRQPETAARTEVIANGVEISDRQPALPVGTEDPWIVCVGRLVDEKGFDVAVRAFARIVRRVPRASLVVVGDGPARSGLEALAAELGVTEHVRFEGRQEPADVAATLARASVVCIPSRWQESFGLVALEAGASARPVVASAVGGLPEIVGDGVTGLLVPPEDEATLGEALLSLLSDPARAQALGLAAYRRVRESFSFARMAEAYERLYAGLAASADGAGPVAATARPPRSA